MIKTQIRRRPEGRLDWLAKEGCAEVKVEESRWTLHDYGGVSEILSWQYIPQKERALK
jgi:hypothetical protein